MNDEPAENISGGDAGGGEFSSFEPATADTRAAAVVERLGGLYWQKTYGGQDAFECLVRTVLSQNTSDTASQPAHDALVERYGAGEDAGGGGARDTRGADLAAALADADRDELAETIASAGLHNQKSETLIRLAGRVCEEYGVSRSEATGGSGRERSERPGVSDERSESEARRGAEQNDGVSVSEASGGSSDWSDGGTDGFDEFVRNADAQEVREALLDMKGVGPKTADCVLLFAGGQPGVFPVDTHVHRIARRLGLAAPDADHEDVRETLEADVPPAKCGFGHTATIQFGREYCTARRPACLDGPEACPLYDFCDRVGVDEVDETVVDPAEEASSD